MSGDEYEIVEENGYEIVFFGIFFVYILFDFVLFEEFFLLFSLRVFFDFFIGKFVMRVLEVGSVGVMKGCFVGSLWVIGSCSCRFDRCKFGLLFLCFFDFSFINCCSVGIDDGRCFV